MKELVELDARETIKDINNALRNVNHYVLKVQKLKESLEGQLLSLIRNLKLLAIIIHLLKKCLLNATTQMIG